MKIKPLVILVRSASYTNRARTRLSKLTASCTSSPEQAAHRLAEKVFRGRSYSLVCEIEPRVCPPVIGRYVAMALKNP